MLSNLLPYNVLNMLITSEIVRGKPQLAWKHVTQHTKKICEKCAYAVFAKLASLFETVFAFTFEEKNLLAWTSVVSVT